jgi:hypothetical protein
MCASPFSIYAMIDGQEGFFARHVASLQAVLHPAAGRSGKSDRLQGG